MPPRRALALALAALLGSACASAPPPRATHDPTEEPKGAGPFQAEEAKQHGPPQLVITNGTEEIVNVELAGPSASKLSIPPGDTQAFSSTAGTYAITLSDPNGAHEATTLAGVEIEDDWIYTWIIRLRAPDPAP